MWINGLFRGARADARKLIWQLRFFNHGLRLSAFLSVFHAAFRKHLPHGEFAGSYAILREKAVVIECLGMSAHNVEELSLFLHT